MIDARASRDWMEVCNTLNRYYENVLKITEGYTSEKTKQLYIYKYNNI